MKLEYFYIKGYRRINEAKIEFGDATFLIGENNIGKSSVLKALEVFFSETLKLQEQDFFKIDHPEYQDEEVILEAKFIDLLDEAKMWKGFKGRIFEETINKKKSNCIYYRKTFYKNGTNGKREMKCQNKTLNTNFEKCKTLDDFIENGIDIKLIEEIFQDLDKSKNITAKEKDKLELISDIWDYDESTSDWFNNPGGFEGVISIKLPKFLLIPAENRKEEIDGSGGTLQKTMKELFDDVRDASENYKHAQHYLNLLAVELDPNDDKKEFGNMIIEINKIIRGVFTDTQIHIDTNLSDAKTSIKPSFDIEMSSNVRTKPERQGMGSIRSTVFALLRYREDFVERKRVSGIVIRPLIIGFEEPEMYLHPNASIMMRNQIYELATSTNSKIICTTHSPYMIDLSKKIDDNNYPKQVLNLLKLENNETLKAYISKSISFNTSEAYINLLADEKQFVKFLLKIDDSISKVFFCKKVIIVEGDTEEIILKETVSRLPEEKQKLFYSNYQVVKARGKATIISLVKYLKYLSITPFVIHDKDLVEGATKFNTPILEALDNVESNRFVVENTIEDILGYPEPSNDKPYKAYKYISENWGENWGDVQKNWREIFETKIAKELFE